MHIIFPCNFTRCEFLIPFNCKGFASRFMATSYWFRVGTSNLNILCCLHLYQIVYDANIEG